MYSVTVEPGCSFERESYVFSCKGIDVSIKEFLESPVVRAGGLRRSMFREIEFVLNTGRVSNPEKVHELYRSSTNDVRELIGEICQMKNSLSAHIGLSEEACETSWRSGNNCIGKNQEIRRFLRGLPEDKRIELIGSSLLRGDRVTCKAILDAPPYLSGLSNDRFDELKSRLYLAGNPLAYTHIQAFKLAISILDEMESGLQEYLGYLQFIAENYVNDYFWMNS